MTPPTPNTAIFLILLFLHVLFAFKLCCDCMFYTWGLLFGIPHKESKRITSLFRKPCFIIAPLTKTFNLETIYTLLPNLSYRRGCSLKWITLWTGVICVIHRTHTCTGDALVSLGETEGQLRVSSQPIVRAVDGGRTPGKNYVGVGREHPTSELWIRLITFMFCGDCSH